MPRPIKNGLDYFPFDVDFFSDIKIRRLIKNAGTEGLAVYLYLLTEVYREGYYLEKNNDLLFDISDRLNLSEDDVKLYLESIIDLGLLNKDFYIKDKILTSFGIQSRYQLIKKLGNTKREIEKYNLVNSEETQVNSEETQVNSKETQVNSEETQVNLELSTQIKENKIKENKREINSSKLDKSVSSISTNDDLLGFSIEVYNSYPRKVGKQSAIKAIRKSIELIAKEKKISALEAKSILIQRVEAYKKLIKKNQLGEKFIKHPSGWFNDSRYDDDDILKLCNAYQTQSQSNPNEIPEGYEDHELLLEKFRINGFINWKPLIVNTIEVNGRKYSKHRTNL